jgi:hypothetical protein
MKPKLVQYMAQLREAYRKERSMGSVTKTLKPDKPVKQVKPVKPPANKSLIERLTKLGCDADTIPSYVTAAKLEKGLAWRDLCRMYGNSCVACGGFGKTKNPGDDNKGLTKDHILPKSKGGFAVIHNLQPLCDTCNNKKGSREIDYRQTPLAQRLMQNSKWRDEVAYMRYLIADSVVQWRGPGGVVSQKHCTFCEDTKKYHRRCPCSCHGKGVMP